MNKSNESRLNTFERKILRKIFGPVEDNGVWRKWFNCELYDLYKEDIDLVRKLKINTLIWAGHMARMDPNNPVKRTFSANPEGKWKVGRPKTRWLDCVGRDLEAIGVRSWKNKAIDKNQWQDILKQAKTRPGL